MKKLTKKPLELSRETVRSLDKPSLEQVGGASGTWCMTGTGSGVKSCGCDSGGCTV